MIVLDDDSDMGFNRATFHKVSLYYFIYDEEERFCSFGVYILIILCYSVDNR